MEVSNVVGMKWFQFDFIDEIWASTGLKWNQTESSHFDSSVKANGTLNDH